MKNEKVKKLNFNFIFLAIILGLIIALYYKYGNVAIVNGKAISRLAYIRNVQKVSGQQVLDQMITESLIQSEADKKGVKIEKAAIDEAIKVIDDQIKEQGQSLDSVLLMAGMTRADLEDKIKMQKLVEKLAAPTTEITQVEIDEFLKTNKDMLPAKATKAELQELAKEQLIQQASQSAITSWLEGLKKDAKIIYK